ncbi:MAG TPA: glycosyltransferase family 4 protein, partial [Terriglobia bacterium]|nr:glycosyltransferase family 4 protein [Terriglobia bacterium]
MVNPQSTIQNPKSTVALLTGGDDRPYVFGLATALISEGAVLDLIGSDDLDFPEFRCDPAVNFLNLRGNQATDAPAAQKALRILKYYARLIRYAATARPRIFHILWNNKFELFDRTLLLLYYKLLGRKVVLTAHNVNAGRRDGNDSALNRVTLQIQYRLADHVFIHTPKMKQELIEDYGVKPARATVIPFGIHNATPKTALTSAEAKQRLGIPTAEKTILFFGRITPYKGLQYLVSAFHKITSRGGNYRLVIAGRPNRCESYWAAVRETIRDEVKSGRVLLRAEHIPDNETEIYFKAADVLVLPYRDVYQSGILFLAQSFGLPVIASQVGSLQ